MVIVVLTEMRKKNNNLVKLLNTGCNAHITCSFGTKYLYSLSKVKEHGLLSMLHVNYHLICCIDSAKEVLIFLFQNIYIKKLERSSKKSKKKKKLWETYV